MMIDALLHEENRELRKLLAQRRAEVKALVASLRWAARAHLSGHDVLVCMCDDCVDARRMLVGSGRPIDGGREP